METSSHQNISSSNLAFCDKSGFSFSPPKIETPTSIFSFSALASNSLPLTKNDIIDLESHQTRLFLGVYFHFINRLLPMVDEEKFRGMYAQLGHCSSHHFSAFIIQLYGILAIISRISCQPVLAEQHIAKARAAAKEMFDQPSEEVISGLCLITYYNYGIGDRVKARCFVALAAQMCHLVPVHDSLLCACKVLCLGSEGAVSLLPPMKRKVDSPVDDFDSAQIQFFLQVLPSCSKMSSRNPEKLDSIQSAHLLSSLDKAWALQEKFNLGGPMNFAFRIIIHGLRSWIYLSTGNLTKAIEFANAASFLTSHKFNIFFCSFIGGLCYQMAKFHHAQNQFHIFSLVTQSLTQIADRWAYMEEPLRRLYSLNQKPNSNPSTELPQESALLSSSSSSSPSSSYLETFDQELETIYSPLSPTSLDSNLNFSFLMENQEVDSSVLHLTGQAWIA